MEERGAMSGMERKMLGVAIVGAGRMGTLRAHLAANHPAVQFIAVSDLDLEQAKSLAKKIGAQVVSGNNREIISHPSVNAVIISTSEHQHTIPILDALAFRKPVLVEKPIALSLLDADRILAALVKSKSSLHVGYSRRFKRRYLLAHEQVVLGRLGRIVGISTRIYNSRAQVLAMLNRNPGGNPCGRLVYLFR